MLVIKSLAQVLLKLSHVEVLEEFIGLVTLAHHLHHIFIIVILFLIVVSAADQSEFGVVDVSLLVHQVLFLFIIIGLTVSRVINADPFKLLASVCHKLSFYYGGIRIGIR